MSAELSFVTVCKGRLEHLKQTLPPRAEQQGTESIVVDYGCPQGTRRWVREHFPQVKVVEVDDDREFSTARGRNLGALAAASGRLCFVDADVKIRHGFVAWVREHWQPRRYYRAAPAGHDIWGTHVCPAGDFAAIGGYDEAMRCWGGEDDDLYIRLENSGCVPSGFPASLLEAIPHDDADRVAFYDIKDRWTSHRVGQVYLAAKADLTRTLGRTLSLEERKKLFAESQRGVLAVPAGSPNPILEVALPSDPRIPSEPEWALEHKLVYRFVRRS